MTYTVQIKVMPLKELLDPQGKAIVGGLQNLGLNSYRRCKGWKKYHVANKCRFAGQAKQIAEEASKKLLANPVMEYFEM